jgi:glycosyltransferase involved in cell wall biosynthesis
MKKKICFIVTSPLVANAFLPHHISVLKTKFDVYVVTNFTDSLTTLSLPQLEPNHSHHIQIERNIQVINDVKALLSLRRYFKQMEFTVVHSITPKAGLLSMIAARMAGIKNRVHIFTGQVWFTKTGLMQRFLMLIDKVIVKFATHILVDGESQRQFLIEKGIIKPANSRVFGKGSISGVEISRFNPDPSVRKKIRGELALTDDQVVFCFLGRINKDKGVLDLANAFKELIKHYSNARLLMVGYDEGNLLPQIQEIIGNDQSLIIYGPTSKPELTLQGADVLCLPSYREGFGTSVIEASLLGLAIICSDTYGLMDTIVEDKTGLRHKVGNVDSLYQQMKRLMDSSGLRNYLGDNGRQYVLENFSAEIVSDYWLNFYLENFEDNNAGYHRI